MSIYIKAENMNIEVSEPYYLYGSRRSLTTLMEALITAEDRTGLESASIAVMPLQSVAASTDTMVLDGTEQTTPKAPDKRVVAPEPVPPAAPVLDPEPVPPAAPVLAPEPVAVQPPLVAAAIVPASKKVVVVPDGTEVVPPKKKKMDRKRQYHSSPSSVFVLHCALKKELRRDDDGGNWYVRGVRISASACNALERSGWIYPYDRDYLGIRPYFLSEEGSRMLNKDRGKYPARSDDLSLLRCGITRFNEGILHGEQRTLGNKKPKQRMRVPGDV